MPNIVDQVWVSVIDTCINNPNHNAVVTRGDSPGFKSVDIGTHGATFLTRVVEVPHQFKELIVRRINRLLAVDLGGQNVVWFSDFHQRVYGQALN